MARSDTSFHVMSKPTGALCNLDCSYCFFLKKAELYPGSAFRMSDDVLDAYIAQLADGHQRGEVTVAWQGGEPTIMGLDFFRRAAQIEQRYQRPGMHFVHTMQTNGTLLDDDWCAFFKEHNYLIGISIDGPRDVHDAYRVDKGGRGTFDNVIRGLRLLQKHGVEYNILVTVNAANGSHPLDVYRFLRDQLGTAWIQFIPVVERETQADGTIGVTERSVGAQQWGAFLNAIFDEWVYRDVGKIFVQTFEAAARNWVGLPSGVCVFSQTCGRAVALEHTGDLYSCDHFVDPEYKLGNIMETTMIDLIESDIQRTFGSDKLDSLPQYCVECDVRFACHGECPKNRFITAPDGSPGLNYLCAGYKAFFHHIDRPMRIIADLVREGRPADEVMAILATEIARAGRNEPCPCGSGKKTKRCHGAEHIVA